MLYAYLESTMTKETEPEGERRQMPIKKYDYTLTPQENAQKFFNDTVGAVLAYIGEAHVGFACTKAVKSELYELLDDGIMPMIDG